MTTTIRDFIYLDLPRLQSFASQLLEGVPESETRTRGRDTAFEGEVRAGLPSFLGASANSKAVLSAASTVTSSVHHRLVGLVLDKLADQHYLWPSGELDAAPDGSFATLTGQVQITDVDALRAVFEDWGQLEQQVNVLQGGVDTQPEQRSRADRRAGRGLQQPTLPKRYTEALVGVLKKFGENNVRIRVIESEQTLAVGVAERDKFVEDLTRLTARHGYRMAGDWEVLAQVNQHPETSPLMPGGGTGLLDLVEQSGFEVLTAFAQISGTGPSDTGEASITPLAIYRTIERRTEPGKR